jgi:8-oxo-dGTP pyrophosphatase MutT (NUDIX family)
MDRRAVTEIPVGKVTALITRPGPDGPELLVFEHPAAGYQLPAGTVEAGESFEAAARREAWEETGTLGLELVRELAVLRIRGEERHLFHFRATIEMPSEWPVITPDGGGLEWWCFWTSIDGAHAMIHEYQRDWLDTARPALDRSAADDAPPRARSPLPAEFEGCDVFEQFHAPPFHGRRVVLAVAESCDPEACTRAHGVCVTDGGEVVLVTDGHGLWDVPGGGKEVGETTVQNFAREVREEACARVIDSRFLFALRFVELEGDGSLHHGGLHAQMWARVELEEWNPQFEMTERRLATPDEAVDLCPFSELTRLLISRAALGDPKLAWEAR